ncbi:MAG: SpoIIE family protein phosphatase [Leptospirales bacterium]|nr:SpoIIE family protein phosphatase [Leptospirales bacterium]
MEIESGTRNKDEELLVEKTSTNRFRIGLRIKFVLPIAVLVMFMFGMLSFYFVVREANILEEHFVASSKRGLAYFQNTAQNALSFGNELALTSFLNDLENNSDHALYAIVTDSNGIVITGFDKRSELKAGFALADGIERSAYLRKEAEENTPSIIIYAPYNGKSRIYEFSAPIENIISKKEIGFIIMGFPDSVIMTEITLTQKRLIYISFGFIILSVIGAFLLSSATIRPIKELSKGMAIIGSGNFDYIIDVKRSDEIGMLADRFNWMTSQIHEAKNNEMKNRIMQEQLDMARDIQEGLNPMTYYHKGGIQIKGFTRAAQEVGGDYFDYIDIDENRIGVLISDVSGKGVPASLVMVMIRTVFTTYTKRVNDIDSAGVVTAINDSLSADFAIDKFATLFFFIYDRKKEELLFSNAGHGPLYCFKREEGVLTSTKLDGMPIGILENAKYQQAKVRLAPGDTIIMFTDGVKEMRNINEEEYGLDRILDMLIKKHDMPADEFVKNLVDDVDDFRKDVPPHDDMTIVVFKRDV